MTGSHTQPVDLIAELRLRQWARANYVAPPNRNDSEWHAIVLDEMRRKDADLAARHSNGCDLPSSSPKPAHRDVPGGVRRIQDGHAVALAPHINTAATQSSAPIPYYA